MLLPKGDPLHGALAHTQKPTPWSTAIWDLLFLLLPLRKPSHLAQDPATCSSLLTTPWTSSGEKTISVSLLSRLIIFNVLSCLSKWK